MEQKRIIIPERQDDSIQILFWSIEEFMPVMFGLTFGLFLGGIKNIALCLGGGLLIAYLYRRTTLNNLPGLMLHLMYRYGIPVGGKQKNAPTRSFINPFIKRLFP